MAVLFFNITTTAQTGNYLPGHPSIDATMTDIEGNVFNLYEALDQNKTIYVWKLSVNSEICWDYYQTGALNTFYSLYGPQGDNTAMVISIGGGNLEFLTGVIGSGLGDYTENTDFRMFGNEGNESEIYNLTTSLMGAAQLGPSTGNRVLRICPDKRVYGMGLAPTLTELVASVGSCDMQTGVNNASLMFTEMDTIRNCPSEMRPVNAFLSNNGTTTMTSCDIALMWQGQVQDVYHWEGSLAPLRYDTVHLVGNLLTNGTDGMAQIAVQNVNGVLDEEHSNDTLSVFLKGAPPINSDEIRVEIMTDGYGETLFWHIADENGVTIDSAGSYQAVDGSYYQPESEYEDDQMYFDTVSLVGHGTSCLTIWVVDRFWNGLCCTYGNGYIRFLSGNDTLFEWSTFKREAFGQVSTTFVATDDAPALSNLKAYPNPTDGQINIAFSLPQTTEVSLEVLNVVGQRVLTLPPSRYMSGNQTIPLELLQVPNGMYWAVLRTRQGTEAVKFVVAK